MGDSAMSMLWSFRGERYMKLIPTPNWYFEHPDYYDKRNVRNVWEEKYEDLTGEDENDSQEIDWR
jgi:hypothetical protein